MDEDEQQEGGPKSSDTPDWDTLDTVMVTLIGALHRALVQVLVGSLQATPHQMVCYSRHGGSRTGSSSECSRKIIELWRSDAMMSA